MSADLYNILTMEDMNDFHFRKATNRDKEKIVHLVREILPEFNLEYSPETSEKDLQDIEKTYTKSGGAFEIVENENGEIIGSVALLKLDDNKCKIRKMYVIKRYRKCGLGQMLLKRILLRAKELGFNEIVLETVHSMTAAIRLYEKYGFEKIEGLQPDSPRCDIVMRKKTESTKDLFSKQSNKYAQYRPSYPDELFSFVLSQLKERKTAWDCGTGNGQMAVRLSSFFETVYATDLSEKQIANAVQKENIIYQIMQAENARFPNRKFDLITVAQAIHWFDFNKFYKQVQAYLKPEGLFTAIGYDVIKINPECDRIIHELYSNILGDYWDLERKYIDEHYRSIPFPFEELPSPEFTQKEIWTFDQLAGYLSTWSAVQHYIQKNKEDPVQKILLQLQKAWGTTEKKEIRFPVFMRIGKMKKNRKI